MHPITIKVKNYLERSNKEAVGMSPEIIQEAADSLSRLLNDRFNNSYSDKFNLRMSNIGRPTCQLQMEKMRTEKEPAPYNLQMQMLLGDIVEIVMIAVLRASGVQVDAVQHPTHIEVQERVIRGTSDVLIDGKVYDIKSCSPFSFERKFSAGFDAVAKDDAFGYVDQGYGYAEGHGLPFGGWIAVNKVTGEVELCEAPADPTVHNKAMNSIHETVHTIDSGAPFKRCFDAEKEMFRGKETGNEVLGFTCSYCSYKYSCWPGLKHAPQKASSAKNPPYKYYTKIKDDDNE